MRFIHRLFVILWTANILLFMWLYHTRSSTDVTPAKEALNKIYVKQSPSSNGLSPCYIVKFPKNRLGNRMNQYAASYGIATWHHCTLVIKANDMLLEFFPNLQATVKDENDNMFRNFTEEYSQTGGRAHVFDSKLMKFKRATKINIKGHLANWKYFSHEIENIKKQFAFSDDVTKASLEFINEAKLKSNSTVAVGIHVRRGDKAKEKMEDFGFTLAPLSYYINAMEIYKKLYKEVVFIVCTDSKYWCRKNLVSNDVILSSGSKPFEDMALLTLCDHNIISVGSFGWWVGFLSKGNTIAYEKQFDPTKPYAYAFANTPYDEIFYPGWTIMNDTQVVVKGYMLH